MFLGSDSFKQQDYGAIKKCSQCGDKNLRFLGMVEQGAPGNPIWMCGNGHIVYATIDRGDPYIVLEGNDLYNFGFYREKGVDGIKDCGCCDTNKCDIPKQIEVTMNGLLGVLGNRKELKHYDPPKCWTSVSYSPTELTEGWQQSSWSANCGCLQMNGGCLDTYYPPNDPNPVYCTSESTVIDNCSDGYLKAEYKFWGPLFYNTIFNNPSSIKRKNVCNSSEYGINCADICNSTTNFYTNDPTSICTGSIKLPACHECGTLKCSDEDARYRLECIAPANEFSYFHPAYKNYANAKSAIYSLPHTITFVTTVDGGVYQGSDPAYACASRDFFVTILPEHNGPISDISECWSPDGLTAFSVNGSWLEIGNGYDGNPVPIFQPRCLREAAGYGIDKNIEDLSNQTIILDRVTSLSLPLTVWDQSEQRARQGVAYQAYIESNPIAGSGSNIEPELVAIIISESGTGGQIAFQTWPVTFDTDQLIDDTTVIGTDTCPKKARVKAYGYGVMYPFMDDPIWKTENASVEGDELSGGNTYNFPVFLPGKNYKVGDKIEFRFWQTLEGEPDPAAGEEFRTVVLATATITEVTNTGGIVWYEFDGQPIAGDCPCTKDKYCGGLSNYCYPPDHPPTEDGLEIVGCYRGPECSEITNPQNCDLGESVYAGSNCYPLSRPWELGGYYGRSSCSGLVEQGHPAYWNGSYTTPPKAPKYSYTWLPDPNCFLYADPEFLEYLAFDNFTYNGIFSNNDHDDYPGCSPLVKVWWNDLLGIYDIKTRFKDYQFVGLAPCRKSDSALNGINTLFVAYSGGDGTVELPPNYGASTRTSDDYCRVYGFYQQKQYNCDITYQGQYILRSQGISNSALSCDPEIGFITITYSRKEIKNDITISAPVNQNYLLPEHLPVPSSGIASATFPFQQGSLQHWTLYTPNDAVPDPRGNCIINSKAYYTSGVIEYDCDNIWIYDQQDGWSSEDYREYTDTFNNRPAWRNTFVKTCGYPWDAECKKTGTNSEFIDPVPECHIDASGEIVCVGVDEAGNFTAPKSDPCDPYCMLKNSSANIAITEIDTMSGCPYGALITDDNRHFMKDCDSDTVFYSAKIDLPWEGPSGQLCQQLTGSSNDAIVFFCYGDDNIVTTAAIDNKIQQYINLWANRYSSIGLNLPGWYALFRNDGEFPYDQDLKDFFNMIFSVEGLAKVKIEYSKCFMATYQPPYGFACPNKADWINQLIGESINKVYEFGGKITGVEILNPGSGYAFEVEERYAPSGIVQPADITLQLTSIQNSLRRKLETWSIDSYSIEHSGTGYSVGDTIPISFNDSDAIRDGVVYKSVPTIQVTEVNESGTIVDTTILNSGEYYKWIKTGKHRAYPISIIVNNYWTGPNGAIGIGRHADLRAVVGVDPTKDDYGRIVDIVIDHGGFEYVPTGKYWTIDTNFSTLGLDHLVDPCKYDLGALDTEPLRLNVAGQYSFEGGWRYVAPPLQMNGGNIIKWSDRALPWSTIIDSGNCPNALMSKSYKMALTEGISLMPADCAGGSECSTVKSTYDEYFNNPEIGSYLACNRWTGFYAHRFKLENRYVTPEESAFGGSKTAGYLPPDAGGCDVRAEGGFGGSCASYGYYGFPNDSNQNGQDTCCAGTEYTIVGNWKNTYNAELGMWMPAHIHRIYKMGGQDITMSISIPE